MNHYPHHIGDFNGATRHLSRLERSIYSDLLDVYYDTEQQLSPDIKTLSRKIIATSAKEIEALKAVLSEFFVLEADGYHNARCDKEISAYKGKSKKAKASADARWGKQNAGANDNKNLCSEDANAYETHNERNANQNQNQNQFKNTHSNARDDFKPDLKTLNTMLHNAGQNYQVTQQELEQTLVTFLPHYETQQLTKNQLMGKLASWVMRDRLKPNTRKSGSVSKIPDNNTTDWMSDELLEMLNAEPN